MNHVLVVDERAIVREGLRRIITDGFPHAIIFLDFVSEEEPRRVNIKINAAMANKISPTKKTIIAISIIAPLELYRWLFPTQHSTIPIIIYLSVKPF